MTTLEKFQEVAKIKFVEYNGDIEIGTTMTQDGYDLHYVNVCFENEIFYYHPRFDVIMNTIDDHRHAGEEITVACYDVDDYFDEYDMLEYLQDNMDEDEFDEFTNE